jgi:hypothetical protein
LFASCFSLYFLLIVKAPLLIYPHFSDFSKFGTPFTAKFYRFFHCAVPDKDRLSPGKRKTSFHGKRTETSASEYWQTEVPPPSCPPQPYANMPLFKESGIFAGGAIQLSRK